MDFPPEGIDSSEAFCFIWIFFGVVMVGLRGENFTLSLGKYFKGKGGFIPV